MFPVLAKPSSHPRVLPVASGRSAVGHRSVRSSPVALIPALIAATVITGCGLKQPPPDLVERIGQSTPYCRAGADCDVKWEATQLWISSNTPNKIRMANGTLIETERNPDGIELVMKAQKVPLGSGRYELRMDIVCETVLGCSPTPHEAHHAYNLHMASFDAKPEAPDSPRERILDSLNRLSEDRNRHLADSIANSAHP